MSHPILPPLCAPLWLPLPLHTLETLKLLHSHCLIESVETPKVPIPQLPCLTSFLLDVPFPSIPL